MFVQMYLYVYAHGPVGLMLIKLSILSIYNLSNFFRKLNLYRLGYYFFILHSLKCWSVHHSIQLRKHRGFYKSGHFIWNLWNEPWASFINFISNDREWKLLFYQMTLWNWILSPSKWTIFQVENALLTRTCGHTIFMTRRYPLNNTDVIW